MPGKHARKSPSSSHRWGGHEACTASVNAQLGRPDNAKAITRFGSTGHHIVDECLSAHIEGRHLEPQSYLGRTMTFWRHDESDDRGMSWSMSGPDLDQVVVEHETAVDEQLVEFCEAHIAFVLERQRVTGGELFIEDRVPIDHITGEEDAEGSTDTTLVYGRTCEVIDLKLGGVEVKAYDIVVPAHEDVISGQHVPAVIEPNSQVAMYASGTMRKLELFYDFDEVVLTISQPSIGRVSQWSGTVAEMNGVIERLRRRSVECDTHPTFHPSPANCHYCRASGDCEAQTRAAITVALEGFDDAGPIRAKGVDPLNLGGQYELLPLVTDWVSAVEQRVKEALHAGQPVVRRDGVAYKLIEGKMAARKWQNEAEAEAALKAMRLGLEQIYKPREVISPTQAEKLWAEKKDRKGNVKVPAVLGPTQANRLKKLITQDRCAPVIALETDPRPAIASALDGFEDVPEADDGSDLF